MIDAQRVGAGGGDEGAEEDERQDDGPGGQGQRFDPGDGAAGAAFGFGGGLRLAHGIFPTTPSTR